MKFLIGQKVRCKDAEHKQFIMGKEYQVRGIAQHGNESFIQAEGENTLVYWRLSSRFEAAIVDDIVYVVNAKNTNLVAGTKYVNPQRKPGAILVNGTWFKETRFTKGQPPEVVPEWKILLGKLREKVGNNPGTCSYAMTDTDGQDVFQVRDVCHARLVDRYDATEYKTAVLDVAGHYNTHEHPEAFKAYVDYIIQRSPWKGAFINRTTDEVVAEGVALNVNEGVNYVVSAAVALRIGYEYMQLAEDFHSLASSGCPEHLAFLTASMCNGYGIKGYYPLNGQRGSHHVVSSSMRFKTLKDFFFKGECKKGESYTGSNQYEILGLIGEGGGEPDTVYTYLKTYPHKSRVRGMWGDVEAIKPNQYGLVPLAFFLAERFNGA